MVRAKQLGILTPGAAFLMLGLATLFLLPPGCGKETKQDEPATESAGKHSSPESGTESREWTAERAHTALKAWNPGYEWDAAFRIEEGRVTGAELTGANIADISPLADMDLAGLDLRGLTISDISPLKGLPLVDLYLEDTRVENLEALRGMKLASLYLNNTRVSDLRPLKAMPLETLNLLGTGVSDISPLEGMPLKFLWLNETDVSDISPVAACPLVSLTLHRTNVTDLRPLAGSGLERLHIGETPVTDLTPLKEMNLTRLIFTPGRITRGMDIARNMASLQEIGPTFENRIPPAAFWAMYDQGMFR